MGRPVVNWQIVTRNPDRLADFYGKLFEWQITTDPTLGCRMVDTCAEGGIGGSIWPAPPEANSFVQLFVEVDDMADHVRRATELGARVIVPPQALPDGGALAILHDPEGTPFGVLRHSTD